ncbi:MAG: lactate utilization protein, partial [Planctomycetales bacterium]|nr:lactate utilization protein [Planctomycetales bacterium]
MTQTDYRRSEHHEFLDASRGAMADENLQRVLGKLGETLGRKNREAWAAFPASDAMRARARAIKDATLADLDKHLETLEASVLARGGHVHWAPDAASACAHVVDIVRQHKAAKVVKSKSMTTEEIHLNAALQAAGVEPIETDLGEFIIQLLGHRPSHIVGPALHLSKREVAETLSEHAGRQLPEDATELARYARAQLRDHFATAQVGVTGVNFAVAETGTIVLITNEGNGRLTTTLPRVHVAIMGMEKVIPKLADLPVFLQVLARAATGQKLSVYTNLCTGPRRPGEVD